MFFADAGDLGECTAGNLAGSVYVAEAPHLGAPAGIPPTVRPIIDGGLAYPAAMAWLRTDDLLISESFLNRVLRPPDGTSTKRLLRRRRRRAGLPRPEVMPRLLHGHHRLQHRLVYRGTMSCS